MMTTRHRTLSEITRPEWVKWNWIDVTCAGDERRKFLMGLERTPDEGARAGKDWDDWNISIKGIENSV